MSVNIAFLGLDQVGISAALALSGKHKSIVCKGWDPDLDKRVSADRYKVFNPVCKSAQEALAGAVLILSTLSLENLKIVFQDIKSSYPEGAVLVNISLQQNMPNQQLKESTGKTVNFICMFPTLNPKYVGESGITAREAQTDLFEGSVIYISDPAQSSAAILDLAVDLAVLLGGNPVFADPREVDGLIAANILLPELVSAALMLTASSQPSWREGQQVAGLELAISTVTLLEELDSQALHANRENLTRLLDNLNAHIELLKQRLQDDQVESLSETLEKCREQREQWLEEKKRAVKSKAIATSIPTQTQALERLVKIGD
jgi:prephenate dehydrogenase